MKAAIIGYGKMGRLVEQFAPVYGFDVVAKLDAGDAITRAALAGADVAIEFTTPDAAVGNIEALCGLGVPVVVGTTGWTQRLPEVRALVERTGGALVWSPNYSIGVQVFFRVVAEAARLMAGAPEYEAWAWEIHHSAKKDAPSGTLTKLVETMRQAGYGERVDVSSNRAGAHPGTHEIGFDSGADTITLRHTARSREGFARGALRAAQWIVGKKGFYEFSEVLFGEAG
ncbi:MAG: dihydrodipicolinate reductase C-terminal domain-containing protein [Bryobacteraceae bacterium]|nr:dihydrodipicolinate reductase C-terminal domain-containing protein [Bryobacteraceae bacterium]